MTDERRFPIVKCPNCGKPVEFRPESRFRPFCSERCRQIDLGAWASESYRIPAAKPPDSMSEDVGDE
ncbi:DNA gyrase inhibitor YacG [Denitromonas iodatirespirans]|uniref:DNA gyrase inhibitor YacG n=1 Tax=Denitromonas iodatirespirans TaxID=2795389 RepID=A0A944DBG6_DENI1|nr:DNA gyrase inhibitor YacG [Denitromonas iodatirespirans]MBT0959643.1 DNA gyrase inhibitor YacG [Denitromonas iodatirespirans]